MSVNLGLIKDSFDKYIVRPSNAFGLGGFIFDIEGESTVQLNSEITDHYVENNTAIQDHIAVKPDRYTLRSYVGELTYRLDEKTNTPIQKVVQKLTILDSYLPPLSNAAQQAKQIFESGLNKEVFNSLTAVTLQDAADLWGLAKNLTPPIGKAQQAFMYFKALRDQKILVSLETPFEYMTNMAIESIIGFYSDSSNEIADFTITLKKMRFASTQTVPFDEDKYQSRTKTQSAPIQTGGKQQGSTVTLDPSSTAPPALPTTIPLNQLPKINVAPVSQKGIAIDTNAIAKKLKSVSLPKVPGIN